MFFVGNRHLSTICCVLCNKTITIYCTLVQNSTFFICTLPDKSASFLLSCHFSLHAFEPTNIIHYTMGLVLISGIHLNMLRVADDNTIKQIGLSHFNVALKYFHTARTPESMKLLPHSPGKPESRVLFALNAFNAANE